MFLRITRGIVVAALLVLAMLHATPAQAGQISDTANWTGKGSAYTSVYADVRRDCGLWTCTSWVTGVRHYSRDYGATSSQVVGRHQWGGISVSSGTVGYQTGAITLTSASDSCTIKAGYYSGTSATFSGGGEVCAAKSNFVIYHDYSKTTGSHRYGTAVYSYTVKAS